MLRYVSVASLLVLFASLARAEFRKSYFAATKPGSWARYAVSYGGPPTMEYTYRRLPDEKASVRIRFEMEFKAGQAKGKKFTYDYWLKPGFPVEKDALSYGKWLSRMQLTQGTGKPKESSPEDVAAVAATMADYGALAKFVDSAVVDGKPCDHYGYTWTRSVRPPATESGNLWLSPSVPFGIVKSDLVIKNPKGQTLTTMQEKLVASGSTP